MARRVARCLALALACAVEIVTASGPAAPPALYDPEADSGRLPRQPYDRFFTQDALGRRIVLYLSEEPAGAAPLPLVAYVEGSGSQSLFVEVEGRLRGTGGHSSLADVVRGRARLDLVEKPGVEYLDAPPDPGGATQASARFRREHTLDRWAEAVHAAIERGSDAPAELDARPRFLLLLSEQDAHEAVTPESTASRIREYGDWARSLRARGRLVSAEKLSHRGLRLVGGIPARAAAEERDPGRPSGYFVIRAESLDDALELAKSCPHLRHGEEVTLRPIDPT